MTQDEIIALLEKAKLGATGSFGFLVFKTVGLKELTDFANLVAAKTLAQTQEPVAWQFFQGGKWHNGMEFHDHRKHTIAAGTPVRDLYTLPPQEQQSCDKRTWVGLTDEQLRTEFGKLYPNDIGILELAENNRDIAVEAIGARHHWVAFQVGSRSAEAKLMEKNT